LKTKILFVTNVDWFFISHRLVIAEEVYKLGYDVFIAAEDTGRSQEIIDKGIKFINLPFSRSGTNPVQEIKTLLKFYKIYNDIKPDIVHHITLKPVIYGSITARFFKIKGVVNAVSGLGYNFTGDRMSLVSKIMLQMMRFGFNRNNISIIFQNRDDFNELKNLKVISDRNIVFWIKGSGVDLNIFKTNTFPSFDKIKILLPIRMLWDKGVRELYDASNLLKNKYNNAIQIILAGLADEDNKAGVSAQFLKSWENGEYVKWIGYQKNMFDVYNDCHIVILPSYREGMPKTLIEACAMGKAIITTDAIGCRECVDEGINGLKVPVKDSKSLAIAIERLVNDPDKIIQMGKASRIKAESEFDINFVIKKHLEIYNQYK
jgi:glycosyltransferase involved in cell wall biosynthesis